MRHTRTVDARLAERAVAVPGASRDARALLAACAAGAFAVELTAPTVIGKALLPPGTFAPVVAVPGNRGAATGVARETMAAVPVVATLLALSVDAELFVLAVAICLTRWVLGLAARQRQAENNCNRGEAKNASIVRHELVISLSAVGNPRERSRSAPNFHTPPEDPKARYAAWPSCGTLWSRAGFAANSPEARYPGAPAALRSSGTTLPPNQTSVNMPITVSPLPTVSPAHAAGNRSRPNGRWGWHQHQWRGRRHVST